MKANTKNIQKNTQKNHYIEKTMYNKKRKAKQNVKF